MKTTGRKRTRNGFNDNIEDAYECNWQSAYTTCLVNDIPLNKLGDITTTSKDRIESLHNSLYCSLGEWNSHVSDLLDIKKFDKIVFSNHFNFENQPTYDHMHALFRHYTRILLVTSEVITDFICVIKLLGMKEKDAREFLYAGSIIPFSVNDIMNFINDVCKHKTLEGKLHCYNHHLPLYFEDCGLPKHSKHLKYITMYKLGDIIGTILHCYKVFDQKLKEEYPVLQPILAKFEDKNITSIVG